MSAVKSKFLFELTIEAAPAYDLREAPDRGRFIVPITGGTFEGPRLKGTILPQGGDWLTFAPDHNKIDVQTVLKTDDGALIAMRYKGVNTITAEIRDRFAAGEAVDPSEYYFRNAPLFETNAPDYAWLNRIIAVGIGWRDATSVGYRVFEIL